MRKKLIKLILLVLLLCSADMTGYAKTEQSYVIDTEGQQQVIPLAYSVSDTYVSFPIMPDHLSEARDICIDSEDYLYILDSGNSRILKINPKGEFQKEFKLSRKYSLSEPQGIHVDDKGNIYVADTGNGRILMMNKKGKVTHVLTQPDSPLYDKDYPFEPIKVGVNTLGQVYAINNLDYHGFCILDLDNEFKGYFAATRLEKNVLGELIKKFASESQKEQMGKEIPAQHSNFVFAEDGSIYVTTVNVDTTQMKHLSTVGNNFYPYTGVFGDETTDYLMKLQGKDKLEQKFVDVCVDSDGIVSILDNSTGRIYQYDSSGVMLLVFGGAGSWRGRMMDAVAMAQDSEGRIYVLDRATGSVQKFEPTDFTQMVHHALALHQDGKYEEAGAVWQSILDVAPDYPSAHIGLGKAKIKQKNYIDAMAEYKEAGDKSGYSNAFSKYLKSAIQDHFLWIVLLLIILVTAIVQLYAFLKECSIKYRSSERKYHEGKHIVTVTLFAPWEAFPLIKYDRQRFDKITPTLILFIAFIVRITRLFVLHYPFAETSAEDILLIQEICGFMIPFILWVAGHYYVSCIFNGEVQMKEVYASTCYALLPYAVFTLPLALLTNIMGSDSATYYNFFTAAVWVWVVLLIFFSIKTMNHYSIGQTVIVMIVSILAVLLLAVVMALIYLLGMKFLNFVVEVIEECKLQFL